MSTYLPMKSNFCCNLFHLLDSIAYLRANDEGFGNCVEMLLKAIVAVFPNKVEGFFGVAGSLR